MFMYDSPLNSLSIEGTIQIPIFRMNVARHSQLRGDLIDQLYMHLLIKLNPPTFSVLPMYLSMYCSSTFSKRNKWMKKFTNANQKKH